MCKEAPRQTKVDEVKILLEKILVVLEKIESQIPADL